MIKELAIFCWLPAISLAFASLFASASPSPADTDAEHLSVENTGQPLTHAQLTELVVLNQQVKYRYNLGNLLGPVKTVTEYETCVGRCDDKPVGVLATYHLDDEGRLLEKRMRAHPDSIRFHYQPGAVHPHRYTKNTYGIIREGSLNYEPSGQMMPEMLEHWRLVEGGYRFYRRACTPECGCTVEHARYLADGRLKSKSKKRYSPDNNRCQKSEVTEVIFTKEGHIASVSTATSMNERPELVRKSVQEYYVDQHGNWLQDTWCRTALEGPEPSCQTQFRDYEYY